MSVVINKIKDKNFLYNQAWFYNNELALRCVLDDASEKNYYKLAINRCFEIYNILFKNTKVSCLFYDKYVYNDYILDYPIWNKYISESFYLELSDLKEDKEYEGLKSIRRNIFLDITPLDLEEVLKTQILVSHIPTYHFVSEENEFIFSIYDYRMCDIVFFDENKYKEFYLKLEKYFFDYDRAKIKEKYMSLKF